MADECYEIDESTQMTYLEAIKGKLSVLLSLGKSVHNLAKNWENLPLLHPPLVHTSD